MLSLADKKQPYGSTTRPFHFGEHLSKAGCQILHICESNPIHRENVETISIGDYGFSLLNYTGRSKKKIMNIILKRIKAFSPDVIYAHQIVCANIGLRLRYQLRRPHVYDAHSSAVLEMPMNTNISLKKRLFLLLNENIILKFTQKIIAPSVDLKNYLIKKYKIHSEKITVIKNGVDLNLFYPESSDKHLRNSLGIPDKATVIVFTNPRIKTFPTNEIALNYFFQMIPEIEKTVPNVYFIVIGGGPEPDPPSDKVIYTGLVDSLRPYINLASICVAPFPSNAICGGIRNKVCEYFACGKAIVSTGEGMRGFDDAIPDVHYLLAKDDQDFVKKIGYLLNNPGKAIQLEQNSLDLSKRYDWEHKSRELQKELKKIAGLVT
jgi:glycosyltransferase involved in cell wall biosynthesis